MILYIAEKPSVGKAIAENLGGTMRPVRGAKGATHILVGDDKVVTWCFGHILETAAPEKYDPALESWSGSEGLLPIIPQQWKLEPVKSAKEQLGAIKDLLKEASLVIHAGDPDREGQLLVDEVLEFLKNKHPVRRILPNAMDTESMRKILADVRDNKDFLGLFESAQGRQRADWLVGMNFTRSCTLVNQRSGLRGVLSVGRVQTPTLAMIVRRDLEIENFKPTTYFSIGAAFRHANGMYIGRWKPSKSQNGLDSEGRLVDESVANALAKAIDGQPGKILEHKVEDGSQSAPLPFSLSTLQSKASSRFGMGAKRVLDIAQALYETHKVATYPRTDCQFLPESQFEIAPRVLKAIAGFDDFGGLVKGANPSRKSKVWNDKKVSAHHAIVPTSNGNYSGLNADERKVFGLIVQNYLAQFYPDFSYKQTTVLTQCGGQQFVSNGRTPIDMGWRKVFGAEIDKPEDAKGNAAEEDNQTLPVMHTNDAVRCEKALKDKKLTKPPAHYTEGTLIRAMTNVHELADDAQTKAKLKEVKGIGTEATRAAIIETLKRREFVEVKAGKVLSTSAGRQFVEALPKELTDAAMTALWENLLDKVEERQLPLDKFMEGQAQFVSKMTRRILDSKIAIAVGMKSSTAAEASRQGAGGACPKCGKGSMRVMQARKGANAGNYFLGCSNFPECKSTSEITGQEASKRSSAPAERSFKKPGASKPAPRKTASSSRGGFKG